jgi:hypothetical protein
MLYKLLCKGSGFTSLGPTPDRIISTHRSERAALAAFEKYKGPAVIKAFCKDASGLTIAYKLS